MSQENVELTLLAIDAWNRRNADALVALWDSEGVWSPALERTTEGRSTYRGHDGMRQSFEDLSEFSEESHAEFPEVQRKCVEARGWLSRAEALEAAGLDP